MVRWKEFWRDQKQSTEPEVNEVIEEESRFMDTGLNTGLKPTFGVKTAKHRSDNHKGFLTAVGKTLPKEAFKRRRFERQNRKTVESYDVFQELKKSRCVYVLTDKTKPTRVIKTKDYKRRVSDRPQKAADLALRLKVMAIYENANLLLEKVKLDLSVKEEEFVRQYLATRAIPSSKILIKDHKTINEKGGFPTRLVIPATNFTTNVSNIGYLGIKRCLDKGKVNYSRNSIIQTSNLKETLVEIGLKIE